MVWDIENKDDDRPSDENKVEILQQLDCSGDKRMMMRWMVYMRPGRWAVSLSKVSLGEERGCVSEWP